MWLLWLKVYDSTTIKVEVLWEYVTKLMVEIEDADVQADVQWLLVQKHGQCRQKPCIQDLP